jgi:hypothetical protein
VKPIEDIASKTHSDRAGVTASQALDEVPEGGFGAMIAAECRIERSIRSDDQRRLPDSCRKKIAYRNDRRLDIEAVSAFCPFTRDRLRIRRNHKPKGTRQK